MAEEHQFTVAIVDDDAAIRRLVRLFLKRSGYRIVECTTGEEARSILNREQWDLAILDRRLPDTDGATLSSELKAQHEHRNRYIIMLTGEDDERDKIEGLDLGADDYMTKPFQPAELLAHIRAGKRIVDLQKELLESNRRLALLSITDGLTQLFNHRHFQEELARAFEESRRYERPLSLALIDLDFFKKINDDYGHAAGDQVLQAVSRIFHESIRSSDLAARYGGEEFAVMMPETDREDAVAFAEKIRTALEAKPIQTDAGEVPVTVSIGIATVPRSALASARELIEAADRALYRAKRNGRNQVQWERRKTGLRRGGNVTPARAVAR
jgi:two-component system, cell cycle response regulator